MIGRAKTTKGSPQAIAYQEDALKVSYSENYNFSTDDLTAKEKFLEMKLVASINENVEKATLTFVLSPPQEVGDKMTNPEWKALAEAYAKEMGFNDNQWKFDVHKNTDEAHLHGCANRIGFNGECTVKAANIGKRTGEFMDKWAKEHGLKTAKEQTAERKEEIKVKIQEALQTSANFEEFGKLMKEKGYTVEISRNEKGINGARFIKNELVKSDEEKSDKEKISKLGYKLSDIDRKLKIKDIEKALQENEQQRNKQKQHESTRTIERNQSIDWGFSR